MKKTSIISLLFILLLPFNVLAGAGGTQFSNLKVYEGYATLDISSSIITTKQYLALFYPLDGTLNPTTPGNYILELKVQKWISTYPENRESSIDKTIVLSNLQVGLNKVFLKVTGVSERDQIKALESEYQFEYQVEPDETIEEEQELAEQEDVDLTIHLEKIKRVRVRQNKMWLKKYRVDCIIENNGKEEISDPIYYSFQAIKSADGTALASNATVKRGSPSGLKGGETKKVTFYLPQNNLNYQFLATVDPGDAISETTEYNNTINFTVGTYTREK